MEDLVSFFSQLGLTAGTRLVGAALALFVGLKLTKWLLLLLKKGAGFSKLEQSLQSFIGSFIRIALYILLFLTVAYILGVPMTSFVTILASAGVAIGLALQGFLSNFAGGLMILLFKPFQVGDYIETVSQSGTVKEITVCYTVLVTPDHKRITLPNGTLTNAAIVNYSVEEQRRVDLTYSVAYRSDSALVRQVLLQLAAAHPLVLAEPAPAVQLSRHSDSSLDFLLWVWTTPADYWQVYYALNEQVKLAFDQNGIEIPFPQMDVHIQPAE